MFYRKEDLKKNKAVIIDCPHCGAEYLAGEIYMPGAIIGQPIELVKDSLGRIIYVDYQSKSNESCMTESFTCEYCGKPFTLNAELSVKVAKEVPEKDFSTQYVPLLSD